MLQVVLDKLEMWIISKFGIMRESDSALVPGSFVYDITTITATFTPAGTLEYGTTYCIELSYASPDMRRSGLNGKYTFNTMEAPSVDLVLTRCAINKTTLLTLSPTGEGSFERLKVAAAGSFGGGDHDSITSMVVLLSSGDVLPWTNDDTVNALTPHSVIFVCLNGDASLPVPNPTTQAPPLTEAVQAVKRSEMALGGVIINNSGVSCVMSGMWRGNKVAIKFLRSSQDERSLSVLAAELEVLSTLHHPRLITLMGVCRDLEPNEGTAALLLEFMEQGSLFSVLHDTTGVTCVLTLSEKLRIVLQLYTPSCVTDW